MKRHSRSPPSGHRCLRTRSPGRGACEADEGSSWGTVTADPVLSRGREKRNVRTLLRGPVNVHHAREARAPRARAHAAPRRIRWFRGARTNAMRPEPVAKSGHRAVTVHRAAIACFCAHETLPSPLETQDREVRRKPFAEVRKKVFAHVTLSWDAPELSRRVHVLAAPCLHHPRHGTGRSGESHLPRSGEKYLRTSPCRYIPPSCHSVFLCSRNPAVTIRDTGQEGPEKAICRGPEKSICARHLVVGRARAIKACSRARGTLPSPSETRDREVRRKPFADVRRKVFAHVTAPLESTELPRCVLVLAKPCRHHPRHGTGKSGGTPRARENGGFRPDAGRTRSVRHWPCEVTMRQGRSRASAHRFSCESDERPS